MIALQESYKQAEGYRKSSRSYGITWERSEYHR